MELHPIELRCSVCGQTKHYLEFYRNRSHPRRGYRDTRCRVCKRQQAKELQEAGYDWRNQLVPYPYEPDGMSRAEVAKALQCTMYEVRKLEASALAKLRQLCGVAA